MKHIAELDKHPDDEDILPQSTFFSKRVFLHNIKERHLVVELLAGDIFKQEFCESPEIETENGPLVVNLVRALNHENDYELPAPFIQNVCKPTSVRGFIQVTCLEPLELSEVILSWSD